MKFSPIQNRIEIRTMGKWILFSLLIGLLTGASSALFLYLLEFVTDYRESNLKIIYFLPLAGLLIGVLYKHYGSAVVKGNNLLLEEIHSPKSIIPFRMAPLVLFGTIVTHLFGGSAGREGTAVQMGGSLSHQLTKFFKLGESDHRLLIILGISGGFASVFGTPFAGAIFALEVIVLGKLRYEFLFPSILTALIADQFCLFLGIKHTNYPLVSTIDFEVTNIIYVLILGISSGFLARTFTYFLEGFSKLFRFFLPNEIYRPFVGGIVICILFQLGLESKFLGLGNPTIEQSFHVNLPVSDFFTKLYVTTLTLGSGFKGGEVTPLFFIGATFGNFFSQVFPLHLEFLAALGFVAVFAGATNTPLACAVMGIELFGGEITMYFGLVTAASYMASGHTGIYSSQRIGSPKFLSRKESKIVTKGL